MYIFFRRLLLIYFVTNKNHLQDCEGIDRIAFGLPFGQDQLLNDIIQVNKNIGVILISGNAVEMPWISNVKGIMQAWYLGSEAGNAIADVISGDWYDANQKYTTGAVYLNGHWLVPAKNKNQVLGIKGNPEDIEILNLEFIQNSKMHT